MKSVTVEKGWRQAFTLVELMIVIAIVMILAVLAIPNYAAYREMAFKAKCTGRLKMLQEAGNAYMSQYPSKTDFSDVSQADFVTLKLLNRELTCPKTGSSLEIGWVAFTGSSQGGCLPTCSYVPATGAAAANFQHVLPANTFAVTPQ